MLPIVVDDIKYMLESIGFIPKFERPQLEPRSHFLPSAASLVSGSYTVEYYKY